MRLNQLDGLLAFWKVAEHRGFTAAAAALEVSPSALSQAIRQLEARLGVRLLNRTTRSVSLTEAGEAYLSRIGPALRDVLDAGEQLHALQGRPSGVLRINAARISTAMVLQPLLAGFLKALPRRPGRADERRGLRRHRRKRVRRRRSHGRKCSKGHGCRAARRPDCRCHRRVARLLQTLSRSTAPFRPGAPQLRAIQVLRQRGHLQVGASRSTADSSSTRSAAISRSATQCSQSRLRWRGSDWRTPSSSSRFPTSRRRG